ncbi:MAG: hypothetical protein GTN89_02915 [Acidobacteria bacterium]|nr:hypothetical protein [Acidobacteriota bacterium]NIM62546.1 hypothetical protein [Acidobacteriota bacterium]NIO58279.1 hypothetical protein [Acidobacteriota bacterium]NIQ29335.1 hypothetical protein [Acidobacteriota bacterium]NIQ83935.1 hypothetical protein [Acidobacteriota bacterium]
MTSRRESRGYGVLETLSPGLARDLGDAFCLAQIGSAPEKEKGKSAGTARGALRFAGRVAVFLLVVAVAVSLTAAVMYLMPLP